MSEGISLPVTVVILTRNEERNVGSCIESVRPYSDDIHVLDSGSTDKTIETALSCGAAVWVNPFTGFGDQRNWSIEHIPHRHKWALHLDADERMTRELAAEIATAIRQAGDAAGFFIASKLMLGSRWLRYSSGYPVYQVRLFHVDRLRFANHGHGQREVADGELRHLEQPYVHYAFSHGIASWLRKHVDYAVREAVEQRQRSAQSESQASSLVGRSAVSRRRALRALAYKAPFRPALRVAYMLVLKRGILDGRAGVTYSRMMACYEEMIRVISSFEELSEESKSPPSSDAVREWTAIDRPSDAIGQHTD